MTNEHDERIAAIKARLDARTPGEWWCWEQGTGNIAVHVTNSDGYVPIATIENGYGDSEFIANAPADMTWLLEHVATLEAQLDAARDRIAAVLEGRRG